MAAKTLTLPLPTPSVSSRLTSGHSAWNQLKLHSYKWVVEVPFQMMVKGQLPKEPGTS